MKVHEKDSLVTYEIYDKSGIMVYETMPLDELSNDRMMIVQTVVMQVGTYPTRNFATLGPL